MSIPIFPADHEIPLHANHPFQSIRRYVTEGASPKSGSNGPIIAVAAGAVAGLAYYWAVLRDVPAAAMVNPSPPTKAFKGGDQGFIDLKLVNVQDVNHNTKRFRFALPDKNDVSGLQIACMDQISLHSFLRPRWILMRVSDSRNYHQVPRSGYGKAGCSSLYSRER